jgi:hypothetical protein
LITLAEQKCWLSLPADVENNAPTAGVPENACPFRDAAPRCRIAWTKPVAMSPAAPLAGVTMTAVANPSNVTRAALAGVRESHRDRHHGRFGDPEVVSSGSPGSER